MDAYARAHLSADDLTPVLQAEAEVSLSDINPALICAVNSMEPFGVGNREPVFVARNLRVVLPPKVLKDKHVKLRISQIDGKGMKFEAMGWRMAERISSDGILANDSLDVAFSLDENTHPEFGGIELRLCDFQRCGLAKTPAQAIATA